MLSEWIAEQANHPLLGLCIALVLALCAWLVLRLLLPLARRLSTPLPLLHDLLSHCATPLQWLLPLLVLQLTLNAQLDPPRYFDSLQHIISLAIIAALTWLGMRAVRSVHTVIARRFPVNVQDNLRARRVQTQSLVLVRTLSGILMLLGIAAMLMTFPAASQFGASLLASAGLAGLAVGFAAKPVLGNLIAGLQIALTQPIRLDDVVIVQNEWGRIEEITGTYVIVRIWDDRRLVVPLQWFIENPFQNWTRVTSSITGQVILWTDYQVPLEPLRQELDRLCRQAPQLWDGRVSVLQAVDCNERALQLRVLVSSADSSRNWDLRCFVREHLLAYLNQHYPQCLPLVRGALQSTSRDDAPTAEPARVPERQPPV
ncbi:MAG: Miniconductance mechanosensitive channel MscM [Pseudomonas citronellolis]|nr:MAG: Miniconductance mechanosensitive channel MscM [Pseudomonas citronellolis]